MAATDAGAAEADGLVSLIGQVKAGYFEQRQRENPPLVRREAGFGGSEPVGTIGQLDLILTERWS